MTESQFLQGKLIGYKLTLKGMFQRRKYPEEGHDCVYQPKSTIVWEFSAMDLIIHYQGEESCRLPYTLCMGVLILDTSAIEYWDCHLGLRCRMYSVAMHRGEVWFYEFQEHAHIGQKPYIAFIAE